MSEKTTKKRNGNSLFWLYLLRVLVLLGPFGAVLAIKHACYFSMATGTISFSVSGALCVILLMMLLFSLPRASGMLFSFGAIFMIAALLSRFFDGAAPAAGTAFLCRLADKTVFLPLYNAAREKRLVQRTAENTAMQIESVIERYVGRV